MYLCTDLTLSMFVVYQTRVCMMKECWLSTVREKIMLQFCHIFPQHWYRHTDATDSPKLGLTPILPMSELA